MAYYQKTMAKIYGILAKPMEHSKGSTEREVYNNTDRPKEDRKISHKQSNPTSKRTRKQQTPEWVEGNNQDQSRN